MASIKDLLNPMPERTPKPPSQSNEESWPPFQRWERQRLLQGFRGRKQRIPAVPKTGREAKSKTPKDGAIFKLGKPKGEVRYPPCEERDEDLLKIHREFKLHPLGNIADYPRHIPYNSQKKDFHEKTGRDSFNTFHYVFTIPGDDVEWMVMWDYNIGLVRITHLFRCNGYTKTAPGKVMASINGLRDICHSITGGALAAQGYWMPYEAAKAVAATFCWEIRHVLTPLFGTDFPSICVPTVNGKARDFPNIKLDSSIILRATQTARAYRSLEPDRGPSSTITRNPTPASGNDDSFADRIPYRQIHPKVPRRSYADSVGSTRDSSSEPSYCHSPQSTVINSFTPVNLPRTAENIPRSGFPSSEGSDNPQNQRTLPMHSFATGRLGNLGLRMDKLAEWHREPTGGTTIDGMSGDEASSLTSPISSDGSDSDDEEDDEDYQDPSSRRETQLKKGKGKEIPGRSSKDRYGDRKNLETGSFAHEVTAAHALLNLHMDKLAKPDSDDEGEARNEPPWGPPLGLFKARNDKKRRVSV
ncbi:APSES transcription factor Xbp1 [Penicillium frequentans]|uniref:APSES transcription factor Xbp1 n=1 Tax=Penicillium frequentans TaxID=3151616 RepID=A0AAD6CU82_9EURO|nr:APSES transcription factor Xbp1 [Penicillium glabrum]